MVSKIPISMAEILKVTPPLWELCEAKGDYVCPEETCRHTFKRSSNLHMHLVKHHKIGSIEPKCKDKIHQFVCPVEGCSRNNSNATYTYFTSKRLLQQHYVKTHAEKIYSCPKCSLKFSIISALNRHIKTCGAKFICGVCDWEYSTNESLLVHLSRKHPETHKKYLDINVIRKRKSTKSNIPEEFDHSNNISDNLEFNQKIFQPSNLKCNSQINSNADPKSFKASETNQDIIDNSLLSKKRVFKIVKQTGSEVSITKDISNVQVLKNLNESVLKKLPVVTVLPSKTEKLYTKNISKDFFVCKKPTAQIKQQPIHFISLSSLSNYKIISIKKLPKKITQSINLSPGKVDNSFSSHNAKIVNERNNISEKCNDYCEDLSNHADRFTQTILKTVKKCDASGTVKNTVETQTSNINIGKHAKLKIDKATNLVFENGQLLCGKSLKRTLATQTLPKPVINNDYKIITPNKSGNFSLGQNRECETNLIESNASGCYNFNKIFKPDLNHMATSCNIVSNNMKFTKDFLNNPKKCTNRSSRNTGRQISLLKKQYQCNDGKLDCKSIDRNKETDFVTNMDVITCGTKIDFTHVQPTTTISEPIQDLGILESTSDRNEPTERLIYSDDTEQSSTKITARNESIVSKSIQTLQASDNELADVISINSLTDLAKDGDNSLEEIFNNNTDYIDTYVTGKKDGSDCHYKRNFDSTSLPHDDSDLTKISSCYGNYSNIETQTALDELLYSNIPNKTQMLENELKDNDVLFSNFICLSDIQTQTSWPNNYKMDIDNLQNTLNSNDNACMDPGGLFTSAETQTIDDVFDFVSDFPLIHDNGENNINSPDLSFKGTQTCFCFLDSPVSFGDRDNSNMDNTCDFTQMSGSSSERNCSSDGLLNSKSDVLLSLSSAETQTCFKDYNLSDESIDDEKDISSNCL